ncbi:MAG: succinate dehydrogenase assembly factor 2 [Cohaesibacteraceae bacterium]|nr:succinate dehydrogenase assembly factor 2 [Cohaesibacteraceae bacterium]MBL4876678.1 succinate dehydrogenase assembly factor 2 [Cohaesibacteraceae bacterium]
MSTGSRRSSNGLEPRRKKILMRAWHRGIKEMDLILGHYVDAKIDTMSLSELDDLEQLMDQSDRLLVTWFTNEKPVDTAFDTVVYRNIRAFHQARSFEF